MKTCLPDLLVSMNKDLALLACPRKKGKKRHSVQGGLKGKSTPRNSLSRRRRGGGPAWMFVKR